jgi:uncharacterized protein (TIGR02996 family)
VADVLAVVSKAIFDKAARGLAPGSVWPTAAYVSANKGLSPLAEGGRLFLVTVRPPDEALWLVAVLDQPAFDGTQWSASPNTMAIRDVSKLKPSIKFANGAGLPAKTGVLGMSLQTPRVLAATDVALLLGGKPELTKPEPKKAEPKKPEPKQEPKVSGLDGAIALAEAGDWAKALRALLAVWRQSPSAALADQIVRFGALAATTTRPQNEVAKYWEALVGLHDPAMLDALLATIRDKGSVKARPRLEQLADWPTDPRLDRWIATHYAEPPLTSTGARPYWTRLQPLLKRITDSTSIGIIKTARAKYKANDDHAQFMATHIDRVIGKLPAMAEVPADPAAIARLAQLGTAAPEPTGVRADDMLAGVLADPTDDSARAVLADALIEAGDPRGELITLQMDPSDSPDKTKRIAKIIKEHRAHLLGSLDGAVGDVTFTKGFASHCALRRSNANAVKLAIKKSVGDPLWATVEHLTGPGDWDITHHPVMRSLRSLANSDLGLKELATWPRLEALDDSLHGGDDEALIGDPAKFVSLRRLTLTIPPLTCGRVLASERPARLAELMLRCRVHFRDHFGEAIDVLASVPTALPVFTLVIMRAELEDEYCTQVRLDRSSGALVATVSLDKVSTKFPQMEEVVRGDVIAALRGAAALSPSKLIVAARIEDAASIEAVARELGAVVTPR